jgi:hypothetical protein
LQPTQRVVSINTPAECFGEMGAVLGERVNSDGAVVAPTPSIAAPAPHSFRKSRRERFIGSSKNIFEFSSSGFGLRFVKRAGKTFFAHLLPFGLEREPAWQFGMFRGGALRTLSGVAFFHIPAMQLNDVARAGPAFFGLDWLAIFRLFGRAEFLF